MPYPSDPNWEGPDVFVEHSGVIVYHCYNGDEIGPAHETYEFSLNTTCGNRRCTCGGHPAAKWPDCRFQFDVRKLPNYKSWPKPITLDQPNSMSKWNMEAWKYYFGAMADFHKEVICAAIDLGHLTPDGVHMPAEEPETAPPGAPHCRSCGQVVPEDVLDARGNCPQCVETSYCPVCGVHAYPLQQGMCKSCYRNCIC